MPRMNKEYITAPIVTNICTISCVIGRAKCRSKSEIIEIERMDLFVSGEQGVPYFLMNMALIRLAA